MYDNQHITTNCRICRGGGTESDPYLISTAQELKDFAAAVNSGDKDACAKLTADIDLGGAAWTTICETGLYYNTTSYSDTGYSGTFDGAGHTISNLALVTSSSIDSSCGLFGTVSGTIKNLRIDSAKILTDGTKDMRTGAVVGQLITANGLVADCMVTNASIVPTPSEHVTGGIAGAVYEGKVENCLVLNSTVTGTNNRYGWIVGDTRGDIKVSSGTDRPGTVTNCYTDGTPVASGQSGNITDCKGSITAEQFASGEIAALLQGDRTDTVWGQLLNTDAYPSLSSQNRVYYGYTDCIHKEYSNSATGGSQTPLAHNYDNGVCTVCGLNNEGKYVIDTADKLMTFASRVNSGETALDAVMTADISVTTDGGFVPVGTSEAPYNGTFDGGNHTLTLDITGESQVAPFAYATGATVKNLTTAGKITTGGQFAAGFVSRANNVTLENCLSTVTITSSVSGDGTHGGLIGTVNGTADTPTTITNCGFAGAINGSSTNNCGGMIGWTDQATKSNITNSYVAGTFTVGTNGSDTFSRNPDYSTLTNCYYLTKLNSVKAGAAQLTAEQFASGAAAWKLNGSKADGVWKQTLTADTVPNFSGAAVYAKYIDCGNIQYTNDASQATEPIDHTFDSDGVCTVCGATLKLEPDADGTYHIKTADQLKLFANLVNGGQTGISGKLMNDIDLLAVCGAEKGSWTPIGNSETNIFRGIFDGQGYTISGLYIDAPAANYLGLFGRISAATVKNLAVVGTVKGKNFVGGVVGCNYGTVSNCSFDGTVSGDCYVGGMVGLHSSNKVANCFNTGTISGSVMVGSIAGYCSSNYSITNCYYLTGTANGGINGEDTAGKAEKKTAEQFASGEVAWLLQGEQTEQVWGQTLTGDAPDPIPTLGGANVHKLTFMNGEEVYATAYANPNGIGAGRMPTKPAVPEDYIFDKWAENDTAAAFTDATTVAKDMTLYAFNISRYINTVLKKITKEDTKDNSEATAVLSRINLDGNTINHITWSYEDFSATCDGTEISGESTVFFGIIVPELLTAAENTETKEITVTID